ncbi:helix-turn-helix domain-containing protein [Conexibacter sp. SYSU D00693]|uniref:helix-turn-helix domain-containing protein n=1 Tax=Conexibacter sp. SYSU D00693 TaxID=2812560 RepID=UPI001F121FA1|nr:helix-turn-helix domain-containing protein [Conexibacter sp. SYSU D00693]
MAETLRVYLEEGSSHAAAARRLGVHTNTISYRVQKAAGLLGRPVDSRRLETSAALMLLDVLRARAEAQPDASPTAC